MKKNNKIFINIFHAVNLILIIFYLYPGSIFGYFLYDNTSIQPQITKDFLIIDFEISSNHFYVFVFLSIIGILAFQNTKKINFLIKIIFIISHSIISYFYS